MGHGLGAVPLVVVRPAEEHEQVAVAGSDAPDRARVPGDGGRCEVREVGDLDLGEGVSEQIGGRHPARAHHQRRVVMIDAGQAGEGLGRLEGGCGRVGVQEIDIGHGPTLPTTRL